MIRSRESGVAGAGDGKGMTIADDDMWVGRVRGEDVRKITLIAGHVSGGARVHEPCIWRW